MSYNFSNKFRIPYRDYSITWYLIAVNALVFFLASLLRGQLVGLLAMNPLGTIFLGQFWTPFTYQFLHVDPMHLIFNMIALYFIGTDVEHSQGSWAFLIYYLGAGLFSGLLSLVFFFLTQSYAVYLLGASGAIYGLLVAYACFFPNRELYVFGLVPIRAPYLVLGYAIIDIVMEFSGRSSGIGHMTHLFGLVYGILVMLFVYKINYFRTLFR